MPTPPIPEIRVYGTDGKLMVRDGVNINFFVGATHSSISWHIADIIRRFWHYWKENVDLFYLDDEGDAVAMDEDVLEQVLSEMINKTGFELYFSDNDSECAGYALHYFGVNVASPLFAGWPDAVSALAISLPTEYAERRGWDEIKALAIRTAQGLPLSSGYVSPALNYLGGGAKFPSFRRIKGLAFRHPGFDVHDISSTALSIDDRLRGVYWLNFFGPKVLEEIGGVDELAPSVGELGVTIEVLDADRAYLCLGQTPQVGDVNRSEVPKVYREVAMILRDHFKRDEIDFPEFSADDMLRWHERFFVT